MQLPPRMGYSAIYYDGRSAKSHSVWVVPQREGLSFTVDGETSHWTYDVIEQTQGDHDAEHVRFQTRDALPQTLVVQDVDILRRIREIAPFETRFHDPASRRNRNPLLVGAGIGIVAMSWLIYMYALPVLVGAATALIPVSVEEALGQTVLGHIAPEEKRSDADIHQQVMTAMTQRLTRTQDSPYDFRVYVVRSDVFNAFALPGGHIAFNTGLIRRMRRPEQLAAILAHEIQHVVQKHGTRSVLRQMSLRALIAAIGGSEGGIDEVLDWASFAGAMSFSREAEAEADRRGVKMMIRARIDPAGAVEAFEILQNRFGDLPQELSYISSHPMTRDRIAALEPYRDSLKVEPEPIISDEEWEAFLAASR